MADRVRFMTWNDTGTPALSSGANGFPAPYNDGSDSTFAYLIAVVFTQIIKWYWRVKQWTISAATMSITAGTGGTAVTNQVVPGDFSPLSGSELQLIQQGTQFGFVTGGSAPMEMDLFVGTVAPSIKKSGSTLYPSLAITGTFSADDGLGNIISVSFINDPSLAGATGNFNAMVDGITVAIYYKVSSTGTTSYDLSALTIIPKVFWPYGALDGSAIYDTATGAQLQSPLN